MRWVLGLVVLQLGHAAGPPALIVTDNPDLITTSTANLAGRLTAAGYAVTISAELPAGSLAPYKEIWDLRFDEAMTAGEINLYVAYLAGGGVLFAIGENATPFPPPGNPSIARDASIASLVTAAGGGTLTIVQVSDSSQTILSPFTGPNAVATISYTAPGGSTTSGNGAFITRDGSNRGAAVFFARGKLTNAAAGSLVVVLDVNFLDPADGGAVNSGLFTNNLIANAVPAPAPAAAAAAGAPTLSEWGMISLGCGLVWVAARKLRVHGAAKLG